MLTDAQKERANQIFNELDSDEMDRRTRGDSIRDKVRELRMLFNATADVPPPPKSLEQQVSAGSTFPDLTPPGTAK